MFCSKAISRINIWTHFPNDNDNSKHLRFQGKGPTGSLRVRLGGCILLGKRKMRRNGKNGEKWEKADKMILCRGHWRTKAEGDSQGG